MQTEELLNLLPFILRPENIARYEDGIVYIGDRRKYPFSKEFVRCETVDDVAWAIKEMVTQGGGPWQAAACAMAMAARQVKGKPAAEALAHLEKARVTLVNTRPTNTYMARRLEEIMSALRTQLPSPNLGARPEERGNMPGVRGGGEGGVSSLPSPNLGARPEERGNLPGASPTADYETFILDWLQRTIAKKYADHATSARLGASLVADGDGVLTMCFAETSFILSMALAVRQGKNIRVFTPETRPYLQGARLTAPCLHEAGVPVQVITDNMPAYVMSEGKIQKYFTAADLVTLDGHVVNKIGTFQNAIAAHHHGIPYFVFMWAADFKSPDRASIHMEFRDPAEIRRCRGVPTTIDELDAYYPAFDITPPHLVAGVITRYGILSPYDLRSHFIPQEPSQEKEPC